MSDPEIKNKLPFNNLFLNAGAVQGFNHWWMYLTGISAAMFGYFVFQIIIQLPLVSMAMSNGISIEEIVADPNIIFNPEKIGINKNLLLALLFGMFVFALLGLRTVIVRIQKKPFLSVITAYEKLRWKRVFFAFGIWAGMVTVATLLQYFLSPETMTVDFKPGQFFLLLLVSVLLMPIQTSTEEIIFRGYLVQGLSGIFKNGIIPIILTSLLFGLVHMANPEAKTFGWLIMFPYYTLFGLFLGALSLLDEGLELALGIHCANNLISSLLITSPNGVLQTDAIFVSTSENPAQEFIAWIVLAAITFIIFWLKYRWKNFNLILR
ncbi:MAG: CPBP family intramembrane metalloprotease [Sphingobacteriaceae bacterium]|nr:CPBP family intramembrane metalloprotease [Sphingobacteriaceae bacterium]